MLVNGKFFELSAAGTSQKSFYGKATVIENGNEILLKSYNTIVCKIVDGNFVKLWDGYSNTTARHINAFRKLYGFSQINKTEWVNMEV